MPQNQLSTTRKLLIALNSPSIGGGGGGAREPNGDKDREVLSLLQEEGLGSDPKIIKTISDHFDSKHGLLYLFKLLKKYNIPVTDSLNNLIAGNIHRVNSIARLLESIKKLNIDFNLFKLEELLATPFSEEYLISGLKQLSDKGYLAPASTKIMFKYRECSLELAEFIINLEERSFSLDSIETKFNQFSKEKMSSILVLLNFVLEQNQFYPGLLDILLQQDQHIDVITEGAKKLALENKLSSSYFETIKNNSINANVFANIILLLSGASLIDYQNLNDLSIAHQLGLGELFFLRYLKSSNLLDAETYQIVYQNRSLLSQEEVINVFRNIPLFGCIKKNELLQLINIMNAPEACEKKLNEFIEIISNHQQIHLNGRGK